LSMSHEKNEMNRDQIQSARLTVEFTTYHGLMAPKAPEDEPPALLIALHGWGENYRVMLKRLRPLSEGPVLTVAPQGPHQFYLDVASRKVGFNWLTVYDRDQAIADVNAYIARLITALKEKETFDQRRIFLLGFSQGSAMAYRFCTSGLYPVAGMISVCADLPLDVAEALPHTPPFPILLAHGEDDPLVGERIVTQAIETLDHLAFPFEAHTFSGGHEITPALAKHIGSWIARQGGSE
jgi:phospholipase/carboxylesterase